MARTVLALCAIVPCALLLLPVVGIVLVALAFASSVRAIARLVEPSFVPWRDLIAFDPQLGWKPRPGVDAHYLADRDDVFRIVTDEEGWPGCSSLDRSDVVVIGDSFVFGYGVDTDRSFAEVERGVRIKAVGAPGYSMVHGVTVMEQLGPRLNGKLVAWFTYLENDLQDNLAPELRGYRAPFVKRNGLQGGWEIVSGHLASTTWTCSNQDTRRLFPRLCVPGPFADRAYSASDYLIERARAACQRVGARLVIVTIPHPMQLTRQGVARLAASSGSPESCDEDFPDRRVAECCRRLRVPMVAGKAYLSSRDYKRREGIHWNERGHRRMAKVLRQLFESFQAGTLDQYIPRDLPGRSDDGVKQHADVIVGPQPFRT